MSRLSKLRSLSPAELWLLVSGIWLIWTIRLALFILPYRWIHRAVRRMARRPAASRKDVPPLDRAAWLLQTAARTLPSRRPCLSVALAAQVLLERRGYETALQIGVARKKAGTLDAHAWLVCNGQVVVGDVGLDRYAVLNGRADRS